MQLDFTVLQNIGSEISSAAGGSPQGRRAAGQKLNPSDTATNANDFRSNLERAGGYRETVSQKKNECDASTAQTENRARTKVNSNSAPQMKGEPASVDSSTPQAPEEEKTKTTEDENLIALVPIVTDTVDPAIDTAGETKVIDFGQPTETPSEMSSAGAKDVISDLPIEVPSGVLPTVGQNDGTAESQVAAVKSESPVSGGVAPGPGVSVAFEGENTSSAAASADHIKEAPEGMDSANTGKPFPTTADFMVDSKASGAISDQPDNQLSGKSLSEPQIIVAKSDHSSEVSEHVPEIAAGKALAQEQAGSERQSPESAKTAGKIAPISEKATVDEGPHRSVLLNESMGRTEADKASRLVVDNEHSSRPHQNSVVPNDSPGSQDGSSASAPKNGPDGDQSVKINDFVFSSQRPVAGDGTTPVSAENLDSRPSAPKADVLNQIVDRAVFKLSKGQSEVRIDLKPDFLGPVRLQIVTESHQVSLRILTESHAVKGIIEGNLGQLKNDLQTQGLKVDEIDVSVAKDFNDSDRRSNSAAHGEHGRRGFAFKGQNHQRNESPDSRRIPTRLDSRAGGIDYFA